LLTKSKKQVFPQKVNDLKILESFDKIIKQSVIGKLHLFKTPNQYFLPRFYTTKDIIISNQPTNTLPQIVSQSSYQNYSTILFKEQNKKIPKEIIEKSKNYIPLFEENNEINKINRIILGQNQNDKVFALNKFVNSDSIINIKYSPQKQKVIISSLPTEEIRINGKSIEENPYVLYEIPAQIGDVLKIGATSIIITDNLDQKIGFNNIKLHKVDKTGTNLIKDNVSFEQGLWQEKPNDCTNSMPGKPDLSMELSNDATDGKYSLELGSRNHYACTSKTFPIKLSKNKIYRFSFDYKNVKGNKVDFGCHLRKENRSYPIGESIETKNHNWNHYETFIEPEEDIESIKIYFYAPSNGTKEVVNRFDNIRLEEWMPKDVFNYYLYSKAEEEIETPILEFKKINPTKYIIRVHQAKDSFPLVFSESFHKGWRAYIAQVQSGKLESYKVESRKLENYKILEGNEEDQATKEELAGFIEKGWVSTLGDGKEKEIKHYNYENGKRILDHIEKYKIDFISKNFQGTIQNNNLPSGHIWDTWLASKLGSSKVESDKVKSNKVKDIFVLNENVIQLPEENHLMANGYANSWWIDLKKVCKVESDKVKGFCLKNPDGTYDFELIVEFWPQRLFYWGLLISGMTLFGCFGYLGYDWRRKRRKNKISKVSKNL